METSDYKATFIWCSDPRVNKFMLYPLYTKAEDVRSWIETINKDEKQMDYGFALKETGELIGSGGIYYQQDTEYTKFDGSATFKAQVYRKNF